MFGIFDDVVESVYDTVEDFVDDPVGYTVQTVTQPIVDAADVLDGLTEGEIREKAVLRLGADVVGGMALGEIIEFLTEE